MVGGGIAGGISGSGNTATNGTSTGEGGSTITFSFFDLTRTIMFGISGSELILFVILIYAIWSEHGIGVVMFRKPRTLLLMLLILSATGYHIVDAMHDLEVRSILEINDGINGSDASQ
ncbi:UNVERIFIED_CONTAM: hypothetical protein HDU68_007834 [Siphonaria sp. JEL0065]|nr:hypothetical protein HDU68_007834 [Siphonaria sp. JEL0065]